jgi:hypothetical protein
MKVSKDDEPRITLELLKWLDTKCPAVTTSNIFGAVDLGVLKYAAGRRQVYEAVLALFNRQNNTDGRIITTSPPPSGDTGADRGKGREGKKEGGTVSRRRNRVKPEPGIDP